ncbi:hypothetical protein [Actinoplanes sp. NPDC051494]|uniref:hypothetical protein n=1 Tax=Actinoplanes sp. NPDC051494 TaxID=3363907 RepID=UPI0037A1FA82
MSGSGDASFDDILDEVRASRVPARPCAGPTSADEPRHPRPAGTGLSMMALYAVDYQGREPDGTRADMDLRPLLDLIAARYAGCETCIERHTRAIAVDPALLTHLVGAALCTLTTLTNQTPARFLLDRLDPAGAAIAITLRSAGLSAAVDAATALSVDNRRSAIRTASGSLLPMSWYDHPMSNFYDDKSRARDGDTAMLESLRHDGYLPG